MCVVTYNQEGYVQQCLQSLVDQVTDFKFQILVADDCSTDNTRSIIREFAANYPDLIVPVFHEKNIGAYKNFVFVHEHARGDYIGHMDGDDYALPGKLQAQADFLDAHPGCNIVFHRMYIKNNARNVIGEDGIDVRRLPDGHFGRADFLRYITLGMNSSKMYRSTVRSFPLPDFPVVDYFANVEQIHAGRACFVGEQPLGVYRNGIGIASAGNGTRLLLKKSMLYFARKYPEHRGDIGVAATTVFVAALKGRNWAACKLYLPVVARTFSLTTFWHMWRVRKVMSMLKIPRALR
jgi:glycosyltransferase involved in cell wall biosynthesis